MRSLISINEIKSATPVNKNVDEKFIMSSLKTTQDIRLRQLIGDALLNRLLSGVGEDGTWIGDNDGYELVINYIQPYLLNQVVSDLIYPLNYKLRNEGIIQSTSDTNLYLPSRADVMTVKDSYEQYANFYANRLSKFLCENIDKFPEYRECGITSANPNATNKIIYLE